MENSTIAEKTSNLAQNHKVCSNAWISHAKSAQDFDKYFDLQRIHILK